MGATSGGRGWGPWVVGSILLLVAFGVGLPILLRHDPQLAARLEAALKDGWTDVDTGTSDTLRVDRAVGFVTTVEWNGDALPEDRYDLADGIVTVFDADRRVLCNAPLDDVRRPEWQALSPWERAGFWPVMDAGTLRVGDVRAGWPAEQAGLRRGDKVLRTGHWGASMMGLRAELVSTLAGGIVFLRVRRNDGDDSVMVRLPALMPAELLRDSSDPLGTWLEYATGC